MNIKRVTKTEHKRWTQEDISFLTENFGLMPVEDIADALERTVMSVRLYIHQHRLVPAGQRTVKKNLLVELLKLRFRHLEDFKPSKYFYAECHITQFRYADLFYGRKQIKVEEYKAIAAYFDITAAEALESRQLELFDPEKMDGTAPRPNITAAEALESHQLELFDPEEMGDSTPPPPT